MRKHIKEGSNELAKIWVGEGNIPDKITANIRAFFLLILITTLEIRD